MRKKSLFIFVLAIIAITLSGCGGKHYYLNAEEDFDTTYEVGSPEPVWLDGIRVSDGDAGTSSDRAVVLPDVTVESNVDMNTVGTYTVTFTVPQYESDEILTEVMTIYIVDTTSPVIEINEDLNRTVYIGNDAPDFGAFVEGVSDNYSELQIGDVEYDASSFDGTTIGTYDVTYRVVDEALNETVETVTFEVKERPILDLEFSSYDFSFEVNTPLPSFFNMITRVIGIDGDLTRGNVSVDVSEVNMNQVGTYTITFTIVDGSITQDIHIDVTIEDTIAPTMVIDDTIQTIFYGHINVNVDRDYLTNVSDNYDELTLDDVVIDNPINFYDTPGIYTITYTLTDSSGNETVETLEITLIALETPVMTMNPEFATEVEVGSEMPNFRTAVSSLYVTYGNNDIETIEIDYEGLDMNTVGEYEVTYHFRSDYNHEVTETMMFRVVDTTLPIIGLSGSMDRTFLEDSEEPDWASYILTISDNYDEGLTVDDVVISTYSVDMNDAGSFYVIYSYTDTQGNTGSSSMEITITENNLPEIYLNEYFDNRVAVFSDLPDFSTLVDSVESMDGLSEVSDVVIDTSSIDMDVVDDYIISLTLTDTDGRIKTIEYTFSVVDASSPNLVWDYTKSLELNMGNELPDFTEWIESVSDNYIPFNIDDVVIDSSLVDMNTEGSYIVTFTLNDGPNTSTYTRTFEVIERSRLYLVPHVGDMTILNSLYRGSGTYYFIEDDERIFVVKFTTHDAPDFITTIYDKTVPNFVNAGLYKDLVVNADGNILFSGYIRDTQDLIQDTMILDITTGEFSYYMPSPLFVLTLEDGQKIDYAHNWFGNVLYRLNDDGSATQISDSNVEYEFLYIEHDTVYENAFLLFEYLIDESIILNLYVDDFVLRGTHTLTEDTVYGFHRSMFYIGDDTGVTLYDFKDGVSMTHTGDYIIGKEFIYLITTDGNEHTINRYGMDTTNVTLMGTFNDYRVNTNTDQLYTVTYSSSESTDYSTLGVYQSFYSNMVTYEDMDYSLYQDDYTKEVYFVFDDVIGNEIITYFHDTGQFRSFEVSDTYVADLFKTDTFYTYHLFFEVTAVEETTVTIKGDDEMAPRTLILGQELTDINIIYSRQNFVIFSANDGEHEYLYNVNLDDLTYTMYHTPYSSETNYQEYKAYGSDTHITIFSSYFIISDTYENITNPSVEIDTIGMNTKVKFYDGVLNGMDILVITYDPYQQQEYTEYYVGHIENGIDSMIKYTYNHLFTSLLIDAPNNDVDRAFGYIDSENQAKLLFGDPNEPLHTVHYHGLLYYEIDEEYFENAFLFNTLGDLEVDPDLTTE